MKTEKNKRNEFWTGNGEGQDNFAVTISDRPKWIPMLDETNSEMRARVRADFERQESYLSYQSLTEKNHHDLLLDKGFEQWGSVVKVTRMYKGTTKALLPVVNQKRSERWANLIHAVYAIETHETKYYRPVSEQAKTYYHRRGVTFNLPPSAVQIFAHKVSREIFNKPKQIKIPEGFSTSFEYKYGSTAELQDLVKKYPKAKLIRTRIGEIRLLKENLNYKFMLPQEKTAIPVHGAKKQKQNLRIITHAGRSRRVA